MLNLFHILFIFYCIDSISFMQKMDKNKDGVVTLEEFIIACQEVGGRKDHKSPFAGDISVSLSIF